MQGVIDFANERVDKNNEKHRAYLRTDCIGLYEVLRKFEATPGIQEVGLRLTTASQSMAAFRQLMTRRVRVSNQEVQDFVRESYFGGRCEIFKRDSREYQRYDVNSLFPTQMRNRPLPIEVLRRSNDVGDFGFHRVDLEIPSTFLPVLGVKYKTPSGKKLLFPTGKISGVYFSEELKLAISQGARVLKHHEGYEFTQENDFFSLFVDLFYKLRLDNPEGPINHAAKIILNSNYGKWAMREEMETLLRVDPKNPETWPDQFSVWRSEKHFQSTGLVSVKETHRRPFMLCHISAAITAWSRIYMAENYYLPLGQNLFYTDTDSIDTAAHLPTGGGLGDVKSEYGEIAYGFYLLPKSYYLRLKNPLLIKGKEINEIKKIKGFRAAFVKGLTLADFQSPANIISKENVLAGFKTSLIKNQSYLSLVDRKRSIVSRYDKRFMYANGTTRPWHLQDGKLR